MWYQKDHVPMYSSKQWYAKIAKTYATFHNFLNERDRGLYQRFLPRTLAWCAVLDIGCGDGRTGVWFAGKWLQRYVGFDVTEELLRRAPHRIEKVVGDAEEVFPFENDSFDIVLCLYAVLHIENLDHLFEEVRRVCKVWGRFILQHHIERRPYLHTAADGEAFKIVTYNHSYQDVEQAAVRAGRAIDILEVDPRHGGGRMYCFS